MRNTAVISHPLIAAPVTVTAETMITDHPLLFVAKSSAPAVPGPGGVLTYTLVVGNEGQPAVNVPLTVTDRVPLSTTLRTIGRDGFTSPVSKEEVKLRCPEHHPMTRAPTSV